VDQTRRKAAKKHGGSRRRLELEAVEPAITPPGDHVLALHEALTKLGQELPDAAEIVMLLHFAGLTTEEAAEVLQVSSCTVKRRWRFAKAWLHDALTDDGRAVTPAE